MEHCPTASLTCTVYMQLLAAYTVKHLIFIWTGDIQMCIIRVVYFLQRQNINTLILIQIKVKNDKMKNGVEIIPANNNC